MSRGARRIPSPGAMQQLGAALAAALPVDDGCVVYLQGELGTGKTTLARGLLGALGHDGRVKSPTYTLVESYPLGAWTVHHLDLYRIERPAEVAHLGVRDLGGPGELVLVEWPERGAGVLPRPDLTVFLQYDGETRLAELTGQSLAGVGVVERLGY